MHPPSSGLAAYLSENRFRLMLLACTLALILMLGIVHVTVGIGPIWAQFDPPAV